MGKQIERIKDKMTFEDETKFISECGNALGVSLVRCGAFQLKNHLILFTKETNAERYHKFVIGDFDISHTIWDKAVVLVSGGKPIGKANKRQHAKLNRILLQYATKKVGEDYIAQFNEFHNNVEKVK